MRAMRGLVYGLALAGALWLIVFGVLLATGVIG